MKLNNHGLPILDSATGVKKKSVHPPFNFARNQMQAFLSIQSFRRGEQFLKGESEVVFESSWTRIDRPDASNQPADDTERSSKGIW